MALTVEMYRMFVHLDREADETLRTWRHLVYHLAAWVAPLALTSFVAADGDFGHMGGPWCWLNHDHPSVALVLTYLPMFAVLIGSVVLISFIVRHFAAISRRTGRGGDTASKAFQLGIYPATFGLLWLIPLLQRLVFSFAAEDADVREALPWITAFLAPSQGLINASVFLLTNKSVRRQLAALLDCCWATQRGQFATSASSHTADGLLDHEGGGAASESPFRPLPDAAAMGATASDLGFARDEGGRLSSADEPDI